jgi:hypothetical protein
MARRRRGYPRSPGITKSLYSADRSAESGKRWQTGAVVGEDVINNLQKLIVRRGDKKVKYDRITKWLGERGLTESSMIPSFNKFVRDDKPTFGIKGIPFEGDSLYQASYLNDPMTKKINEIFGFDDPVSQAAINIRNANPHLFSTSPLKVGP